MSRASQPSSSATASCDVKTTVSPRASFTPRFRCGRGRTPPADLVHHRAAFTRPLGASVRVARVDDHDLDLLLHLLRGDAGKAAREVGTAVLDGDDDEIKARVRTPASDCCGVGAPDRCDRPVTRVPARDERFQLAGVEIRDTVSRDQPVGRPRREVCDRPDRSQSFRTKRPPCVVYARTSSSRSPRASGGTDEDVHDDHEVEALVRRARVRSRVDGSKRRTTRVSLVEVADLRRDVDPCIPCVGEPTSNRDAIWPSPQPTSSIDVASTIPDSEWAQASRSMNWRRYSC